MVVTYASAMTPKRGSRLNDAVNPPGINIVDAILAGVIGNIPEAIGLNRFVGC